MPHETHPSTPKKRFGLKRILLCGVLLIVGTALALAFCVFHPTHLSVVHADAAMAEQLRIRIKQAETSAANGHRQTVSMSEAEINSLIESQLTEFRTTHKEQSALRDVNVHLVGDQIQVHLLANVYGQNMTFDVAGKLRSTEGYLRFDPASAKVGALPIPAAALRNAVQQAMNSHEGSENMRLPANLSDLRVEQGRLVATYQ